MPRVRIIQTFTGGPDGRRPFVAGDEVELSDGDAKLYVAKGHAVAIEPEPVQKLTKDVKR